MLETILSRFLAISVNAPLSLFSLQIRDIHFIRNAVEKNTLSGEKNTNCSSIQYIRTELYSALQFEFDCYLALGVQYVGAIALSVTR